MDPNRGCRQATERDFRKDVFKDARLEDYEVGPDGEVVRKDRYITLANDMFDSLGRLLQDLFPDQTFEQRLPHHDASPVTTLGRLVHLSLAVRDRSSGNTISKELYEQTLRDLDKQNQGFRYVSVADGIWKMLKEQGVAKE